MPSCECGCGFEARNRFVRGHNSFVQKNAEKPLTERLKKYVVDEDTGCWIWTGALNNKGYGRIAYGGGSRWKLAYKVMWEHINGPTPEGHHLHHVCENRRCVRPDDDHVVAVTHAWHTNYHLNGIVS